jgi:ferredoxin, 2Fe-2S
MPTVTFLPMNATFTAEQDESILDVAIRNEVPIQHACGGYCACTTCHVRVKSGADQLSAMDDEELDRLEVATDGMEVGSRLGCQAKVLGDVVVEVMNIDERY